MLKVHIIEDDDDDDDDVLRFRAGVVCRVVEVKALSHLDYPISYELTTESGGQSNEFAVDSSTGVVDLLRSLDYETDPVQYHLQVRAFENRRQPVTSTVNVRSLPLPFC